MFLAVLRLLVELNPSPNNQKTSGNALEDLGYTWDEINKMTAVSRDGMALLKLYYEQRLSGQLAINEISKDLLNSFRKSSDGLIKALWKQIQRRGSLQLGQFGKRERRVPRLKYGLTALVVVLWVIVIGFLGVQFFSYFEHTQTLQMENKELVIELKKS
jgi:hypothetical protein